MAQSKAQTPPPKGKTWRRRCMVKGCSQHRKWFTSETEPLPTDHPDSHYSQVHAATADISPRRKFRPRP